MRISKHIFIFIFFFSLLFFKTEFLGAVPPDRAEQKEVALHYYRGVVNYEAGRFDGAMQEFQAASSVDPYYKDTQKYLNRCVKHLEKYRDDLFKAQGMDSKDKGTVDLYFLGRSYYEKGNYQKALDSFKAVLDKDPNDRFALYYARLCEDKMPSLRSRNQSGSTYALGDHIDDFEKEVSYIKSDIKNQEDWERFLAAKAERKAAREELIQKKQMQLQQQEELLEEERQDYLAQAALEQKAHKLQKETEKWRNMKEKLASKEPGMPSDLIEFPIYLNRGERYYVHMKESLRQSRWHSAGLNAIYASINFCDSYLIYNHGVRSAEPNHENISRLLMQYVHRSDVDENLFRLRALLNLKKLIEQEDRPIRRDEAIYAADYTDKIVEWCKSLFP
ncbi:MAG: tetratricopeptide repeat protein [Candidatus Omnitrophota bacterium]